MDKLKVLQEFRVEVEIRLEQSDLRQDPEKVIKDLREQEELKEIQELELKVTKE